MTKFLLTKSQEQAFIKFERFINTSESSVFILKGYAGTGKTTLIKEFIKLLKNELRQYCLLASTGRAAKILKNVVGDTNARTIHSKIYGFDGLNTNIADLVNKIDIEHNDYNQWLFPKFGLLSGIGKSIIIIDESSMISDAEDKNPRMGIFGSGKLLSDIMTFSQDAKIVFVGDNHQLPPVNQEFSPALARSYIKTNFNTDVTEAELTEIVRQKTFNDIITVSQKIRQLIDDNLQNDERKTVQIPLKGYNNIKIEPNISIMLDSYFNDIKEKNFNNSIFICLSNKECRTISDTIRKKFGFKEIIEKGDLLLVTRNNMLSGLYNGDFVKVISIGERIQKANLTFVKVELQELVTKRRISQYLIENVFSGNRKGELTRDQQRNLYIDFYKRMKTKGIHHASKQFKDEMQKDEYLNGLCCSYGYAITCHKAQGGEWPTVYLTIPWYFSKHPKYRWLYTAITRAKDTLII